MQFENVRTRSFVNHTIGLGAVLVALALPATASAQDALGSGDVLDANLSTAGTRNSSTADESLAYRVRNLLVTGNVAGGRGFRGSVGYTAAEDFRGALGSDDLFEFRSQAAFSAPSYVLYRNQLTDLQIGQDLGTLEFRRSTTGETLRDVMAGSTRFDQEFHGAQLRLDRLISDVTLSENIERASESRPIGIGKDKQGNTIVPMSTSVLGIDTVTLAEAQRTAGMTVFDRARLMEDLMNDAVAPESIQSVQTNQSPFTKMLAVDTRITGTAVDTKVETGALTHDDLLKKVAERYTDGVGLDEETAEAMDEKYSDIQEYLRGFRDPDEAESATEETMRSETGLEVTLPQAGDEETTDESDDAGIAPATPQTPDVLPTLESFGIALRHGQTVKSYASGDDDRFNELVTSAQQSLTTGEYFWAERRFARALRFRPLHPLASAGKAHAQLGAGLYTPAALSLRQVLRRYPEMIDVRYDRDILPTRVRLQQNINLIRERLEQGMEPAMMGFLLAYIGHQFDDRAMVEEGLDAMQRASPDDRLLPLLRTIWTEVDETDDGSQTP